MCVCFFCILSGLKGRCGSPMTDNPLDELPEIEDSALDLLSPVSLSAIVARATPVKATPGASVAQKGLLDAFEGQVGLDEDLLL